MHLCKKVPLRPRLASFVSSSHIGRFFFAVLAKSCRSQQGLSDDMMSTFCQKTGSCMSEAEDRNSSLSAFAEERPRPRNQSSSKKNAYAFKYNIGQRLRLCGTKTSVMVVERHLPGSSHHDPSLVNRKETSHHLHDTTVWLRVSRLFCQDFKKWIFQSFRRTFVLLSTLYLPCNCLHRLFFFNVLYIVLPRELSLSSHSTTYFS